MRLSRLIAGTIGCCMCASPALAGPPYQTDDPEPTELNHWEIYNFVDVDGRNSDFAGEAGLDLNFGAARGLQLTATLPLAFSHAPETGWRAGRGDVEVGAKYRVINEPGAGWQAAIFPRIILPTSSGHLGGTTTRVLLPIWVQKDFGRTSIFGGGGYEINPGTGNRSFWQAGIALTHDFSDELQIGTEVSWQAPDVWGGKSSNSVDVGVIRKLGGRFSLLAAGGPTISGRETSYHVYAALGLTF